MAQSIILTSAEIIKLIDTTIESVEAAKKLSQFAVNKEVEANENTKMAKGFALFLLDSMEKQKLSTLSSLDSDSMRSMGLRAINSREESESATAEAKKATQEAGERVQCVIELFRNLQRNQLSTKTAVANLPYVTIADEPCDRRSSPLTLEDSLEYARNYLKLAEKRGTNV
jgi:hypothetical protein